MENVRKSRNSISAKWAIIYVVTSIVITYTFQFLNMDQTSPIRYLAYIPFIAFLMLAQKEFKDQLGGFISFGEGFMTGFIYSVIGGVLIAIFLYIYLTFLSPQVFDQIMAVQRDKLGENKNMSSERIDQTMDIMKKYGTLISAFFIAIGVTIFGAIIALIGAAILKKERSIYDIEQNSESYTDPA